MRLGSLLKGSLKGKLLQILVIMRSLWHLMKYVTCRVADMLVEMSAIEKREAEDTAALENMVQQVEANLAATTVRYLEFTGLYFRFLFVFSESNTKCLQFRNAQ